MNALPQDAETYATPEHGWTCFHCGVNFPGTRAGEQAAREHFGHYIDSIPGCRLRMRGGERSLLRRIRWLERKYRTLQHRVSEEDVINRQICEHRQALLREEEKGYARGLDDRRAELLAAQAALVRIASDHEVTDGGHRKNLSRVAAINLARETCERLGWHYALESVLARPQGRPGPIDRLKNACRLARNILHAHNRPDVPLSNEDRIRARDILDLALEGGE